MVVIITIIIISDISIIMTSPSTHHEDVTATSACPHHKVRPHEVPHHLLRRSQQDSQAEGDAADQVEARSRAEQLGGGGGGRGCGWGDGGDKTKGSGWQETGDSGHMESWQK